MQPAAQHEPCLSDCSIHTVPVSDVNGFDCGWLHDNEESTCGCCLGLYLTAYTFAVCDRHFIEVYTVHMSTQLVSNIILTDMPVTDSLNSMSIKDFYMLKAYFVITLFSLGSQHEQYNEAAVYIQTGSLWNSSFTQTADDHITALCWVTAHRPPDANYRDTHNNCAIIRVDCTIKV